MPSNFKDLDWHPMPEDIRTIIDKIREGVSALRELAKSDDVTRKFTLDGRFVGDIGEWLVARRFSVVLDGAQKSGHDATVTIGQTLRRIQVKCRCESDAIDFTSEPDLLVVIEVRPDWSQWRTIYNGPGQPVVQLGEKKKVRVNLQKLSAANDTVPDIERVPLRPIE